MNDLLSKLEGQEWDRWWGSSFLLVLGPRHYTNWKTSNYGKRNHDLALLSEEAPPPMTSHLNSLCCFIWCTVCVTDTDLCANTDVHKAAVSSRQFWPFFMHSRCSGGHGNTYRRVVAASVYVLGFVRARPITQLWVVLPSNGGYQNWRPHLISRP